MTPAPTPTPAPRPPLSLAEPGSWRRDRQSGVPVSTGSAGFADVLRLVGAGMRPELVAARLGVPDELVDLALEQAEALGLVYRPCGPTSGRGCPTGPDRPLGCAGCPFAR